MAASSNQNVDSFMHEAKIAGCGALIFVIGMAAATTAGLYRTNGGKKYLYSVWSYSVGSVAFVGLCALVVAWKDRQRFRKWIAGAPAWMKTIQTSIILIFIILVCYIGEGSLGGITFFFGASIATLGLLPLFLNDLGLMNFFIGGAINTVVVNFSLGGWTWAALVGCIIIILLQNVLEKRLAIPAAAIEMRRDEEIQAPQIGVAIPVAAIEMMRDEDVELEIQAPEIEVAIPTAAIEMRRDEDVELEIQAPEIGVAIPAAAIEMRRDEDVELEIQAP